MSFPRHPEIYRPMWPSLWPSLGATTAAAPTHRLDEFPAGYSLAGRSPAEPASASPAGYEYAVQSFCRSRIFQRTANSVLTVCVSPGGKRKVCHSHCRPRRLVAGLSPIRACYVKVTRSRLGVQPRGGELCHRPYFAGWDVDSVRFRDANDLGARRGWAELRLQRDAMPPAWPDTPLRFGFNLLLQARQRQSADLPCLNSSAVGKGTELFECEPYFLPCLRAPLTIPRSSRSDRSAGSSLSG